MNMTKHNPTTTSKNKFRSMLSLLLTNFGKGTNSQKESTPPKKKKSSPKITTNTPTENNLVTTNSSQLVELYIANTRILKVINPTIKVNPCGSNNSNLKENGRMIERKPSTHGRSVWKKSKLENLRNDLKNELYQFLS